MTDNAQWLPEEVARQGKRLLAGGASRAGAITAITKAMSGHPDYVEGLKAADAERKLTRWLREHAEEKDSPQLPLFPAIPLRLPVAPGKAADTGSMTANQLDKAKNVLLNRIEHQINGIEGAKTGAERERDEFLDFYKQVRPLMGDGRTTVREALKQLAAKRAAA